VYCRSLGYICGMAATTIEEEVELRVRVQRSLVDRIKLRARAERRTTPKQVAHLLEQAMSDGKEKDEN
jgi:hypothetical protein